ncbi:carbohydrate ABC transporter permease [Mesorhizobium sp. YIM 152430]|jgi:multiple sugar transport system permease protein|uniref:carbohydrate ABC transporter permease n=1 Tax=Mesorhizobium sp. YIM 152430 TaxID=3031761 RepID=UPI0023DA3FBF|nr:carbohydrate ABC transporter permease [Mesorhizobium sp. YIM 152430]MDF1598465.1 carbohydrate ABC transporter permease [Mesorhizobium sp. YIM 152430]
MMRFPRPRVMVLIAGLIVVVNGFVPAIWIVLTSLKTEAELLRLPITILPDTLTFQNYTRVFTDQPILTFMWNSVAVATLSTLLCVTVSALAAYALVRLRLPAPGLILSLLMAIAMFPLISLMVPLFQVMRTIGLLNTWWALVFPYAVLSMPVCTMVLISFFQDIPKDLESAAMIDGCSRLGALWHVVIPLTAPGVFTAGILAFVNAWDEFLLALTLSSRVSSRTLPVGITLYQGEFSFPWPIISAALVVAIVPISIIIALFQERVVGGLTQGGMKG